MYASRPSVRRRAAAIVLVASAALFVAPPARADGLCDETALPILRFHVVDSFGGVRAEPGGTAIQVWDSTTGFVDCPAATTANTTSIQVRDDGATFGSVFSIDPAGLEDETITLDFSDGSNDRVVVRGDDGGNDHFVIGGTGIVNVDAAEGSDVEITSATGIEDYVFAGQFGDDIIDARGGSGTGTGASIPLSLDGGVGSDTVAGGSANDELLGGGGGTDLVIGGPGADEIGEGMLDYSASPEGVTVEISFDDGLGEFVGTFDGGDAEGDTLAPGRVTGLRGTAFADTLSLSTSLGTVEGGPDGDTMTGGASVLSFLSYEHSADPVTVDLAAGSATGGDASGDTFSGFRSVRGSDSSGTDKLTGVDAGSRLRGGAGPDVLTGAGGGDVLDGGPGADEIDGGAGGDTVSYEFSTDGVDVDLLRVDPQVDGDAHGDKIALGTVENITGSAHDDALAGNDVSNSISGRAGADVVRGRGGNDTVDGGAGGDDLDGGETNETVGDLLTYSSFAGVVVDLSGAAANTGGDAEGDTFCATAPCTGSFEQVRGTNEDDMLLGTAQSETLLGRDGDDVLRGRAGEDSLSGGDGDDEIEGGSGGDTLGGGAADETDGDTLSYASSSAGVQVDLTATTATGGDAAGDTITVDFENLIGSAKADRLAGGSVPNRIDGGDGGDTIAGGTGIDELIGGLGDDTFDEGVSANGADLLNGGDGADTTDYGDREGSVTVILDEQPNDGESSEGDDVRTENVAAGFSLDFTGDAANNVVTGGEWNDVLRGGDGDDRLSGRTGTDLLYGGSGTDVLSGGPAGDYINGGPGTDTADYGSSLSGVSINLAARSASGGDASGDVIASTSDVSHSENLSGSSYNDTLVGDARVNVLTGNGGNDVLDGGAQSDVLSGGAGNDTFRQASVTDGGDDMTGGTGIDLVSYAARRVAVTVRIDSSAGDGASGEGDRVRPDVENVTAGAGHDVIVGSSAANTIVGGAGNDNINGGSGNDRLLGGVGNDILTGNLGIDLLGGDAGNDTLYGRDGTRDSLSGGVGTDRARRDTIDGVAGIEAFF